MIDLNDYKQMAPILLDETGKWKEIVIDCPVQAQKAGSLIRMQGSEEGDVIIVKEGYVLVTVLLDDGTEAIQYIGGEGCMFGYISATSGFPYMSTLHSLTDCKYYVISKQQANYLMKNNPAFSMHALMISSMQGDIYFNRISLLAISQTNIRLLHLLLGFAASVGKKKSKNCVIIQLELTHQLLSEILLVNRVTISRMMSALNRQGAVTKNGKFYELNLNAIEKIAFD